MKRADRPRREWSEDRVILAIVLTVVTLGVVITSAISYQHEYVLASRNGQVGWVSSLLPFSVDGQIFVAGVALLWAAMHGIRGLKRLWQPLGVLAAGVAATIAANYFSDLKLAWLGPAVSASSGVALVLMSAVAFWLLAEQRKLSRGDDPQPAVNCSCPPPLPPSVTLAEALPLAREELRSRGEQYGEEALAERFGVTRHKVRSTLAVQTAQLDPSDAAGAPEPAPPGAPRPPQSAMNGHGNGEPS